MTAQEVSMATQAVVDDAHFANLQSSIRNIWADVLERPDLKLDDDFYEAGGDSMMMMIIIFRIHEDCGVELSSGALEASPTVLQCAAIVAAALSTSTASAATGDGTQTLNEGVI
jgi:acyl carrier protein